MGADDSSGTSRPTTTDSKVHSAHHWPRDVEAPMSEPVEIVYRRYGSLRARSCGIPLAILRPRLAERMNKRAAAEMEYAFFGPRMYFRYLSARDKAEAESALPGIIAAWNRRAEVSDE